MSEPQLRLVSPPPADANSDIGTGTIGCFDLPALSTQVALALDAVSAAFTAERSRFRSVQLTRAHLVLADLYQTIEDMQAIRE
jgi:hypothetical protein